MDCRRSSCSFAPGFTRPHSATLPMAITNQERVGKAVDLLRLGLARYVVREFASAHKDKALAEARRA